MKPAVTCATQVGTKICNIHAHYTSSNRIAWNWAGKESLKRFRHVCMSTRLAKLRSSATSAPRTFSMIFQAILIGSFHKVCETTPHDIPAESSELFPQWSWLNTADCSPERHIVGCQGLSKKGYPKTSMALKALNIILIIFHKLP